jgi:hypothetical protein
VGRGGGEIEAHRLQLFSVNLQQSAKIFIGVYLDRTYHVQYPLNVDNDGDDWDFCDICRIVDQLVIDPQFKLIIDWGLGYSLINSWPAVCLAEKGHMVITGE